VCAVVEWGRPGGGAGCGVRVTGGAVGSGLLAHLGVRGRMARHRAHRAVCYLWCFCDQDVTFLLKMLHFALEFQRNWGFAV
jgi:hypothetical protein